MTKPLIDDSTLYEKCAHCHLFITDNPSYGGDNYDRDDIAEFDHLDRGDEADEAITSTHEAKPSGMRANLATWRKFGPAAMVARFDVNATITWKVTRTFTAALDIEHSLLEADMSDRLAERLADIELNLSARDITVEIATYRINN